MRMIIDIPKSEYEVIMKHWGGYQGGCYSVYDAIKNGTPLPKGHWINTPDYVTCAYGCIDYVKCSECGEDSLEEGDFCPNCGAKMESEE